METPVPAAPVWSRQPPPMSGRDLVADLLRRRGERVPQTEEEWAASEVEARRRIDAMAEQSERRQRALDAHRKKLRTKNARATRPPPEPSRQYCPATPTMLDRDQRLCPGARATLHQVRAMVGNGHSRVIYKAKLARDLGISERTVQRHLAAGRLAGYLWTEPVFDDRGRQSGQRIHITDQFLPYWMQPAGGDKDVLQKGFSRNLLHKVFPTIAPPASAQRPSGQQRPLAGTG